MQIFISYAMPSGGVIATAISTLIKNLDHRLDPWTSVKDLPVTANFREEIEKVVKNADGMILIVTPDSIGELWPIFEAGGFLFSSSNRPLLVVLFETKRKQMERLPFNHLQAVEYWREDDESRRQLQNAISELFIKLKLPDARTVVHNHFAFNITFFEESVARIKWRDSNDDAGGIMTAWIGKRKVLNTQWNGIFKSSKKRIWLMGHTMAGAVTPDGESSRAEIKAAILRGVDVRLVVLDPEVPTDAFINEIDRSLTEHDGVRSKARETLRHASSLWKEVNDITIPDGKQKRFSIGVTNSTIHNSIAIVDDEIFLTNYSHAEEFGNNGPTVRLDATLPSHDVFTRFCEGEFMWHWQRARPVYDVSGVTPPVELRALDQLEKVENSRQWFRRGPSESLQTPHIAVIYPTYRCNYGSVLKAGESDPANLLCESCMFLPILNKATKTSPVPEMSLANFQTILTGLAERGVRIIEIAGGGEPMHHSRAEGLLKIMSATREIKSGKLPPKIGLISNIKFLQRKKLWNEIISATDYIRWSWSESVPPDGAEADEYFRLLDEFADIARNNAHPPRIGVKFIATKANCAEGGKSLVTLVQRAFDAGIDHVKVRSLRSPGETKSEVQWHDKLDRAASLDELRITADALEQLAVKLRNDLVLPKNRHVPGNDRSLEVDLLKRFVNLGFQCQLSTLFAIIDPNSNLRMCWNDVLDAHRSIGTIVDKEGSFIWDKVWGSIHHHQKCRPGIENGDTTRISDICNNSNGCHCRVVGYHQAASHLLAQDTRMRVLPGKVYFGDNYL